MVSSKIMICTPEKSKDSGEAQADQISPSTLEAAQILTNVASEGFKGSQAPLGSKIYRRKPKSTPTPTKILDFEEPAETQVNTGEVNTASEVNTGSIKLNTVIEQDSTAGEDKGQREGKAPMLSEETPKKSKANNYAELKLCRSCHRACLAVNFKRRFCKRMVDLVKSKKKFLFADEKS
ncbi:hypothetical protein Tco_0940889 [Tanacetum coccineum]|uniref:Uncharacterized protein n=1 Tax=Tanacetum coccineum TaxID=301880 RepID=A0ABQ5DVC5_9ASTR